MTLLVACTAFLLGVLAGVVLDDALDLYRASRKDRPMRLHLPNGRTLLGAALVVAVLLQFAVGVMLIDARRDLDNSVRRQSEFAACNVRWQQSFAAAYQARVRASADVTEALEQVVRAVDTQNPNRFREAVTTYIELRDRQDREVRRNQYPPLPAELCGEAPKEDAR